MGIQYLNNYIKRKANNDSIMKANLSVQVSDDFMKCASNYKYYNLSFTRHSGETITSWVKADDILDRLVKNNYNWAEPGTQYIDRMKKGTKLEPVDFFKNK